MAEVIISPILHKNSNCLPNFCYIYVRNSVIFSFFGCRILISILSELHHISTLIFRQKANHTTTSLFWIMKLVILNYWVINFLNLILELWFLNGHKFNNSHKILFMYLVEKITKINLETRLNDFTATFIIKKSFFLLNYLYLRIISHYLLLNFKLI